MVEKLVATTKASWRKGLPSLIQRGKALTIQTKENWVNWDLLEEAPFSKKKKKKKGQP